MRGFIRFNRAEWGHSFRVREVTVARGMSRRGRRHRSRGPLAEVEDDSRRKENGRSGCWTRDIGENVAVTGKIERAAPRGHTELLPFFGEQCEVDVEGSADIAERGSHAQRVPSVRTRVISAFDLHNRTLKTNARTVESDTVYGHVFLHTRRSTTYSSESQRHIHSRCFHCFPLASASRPVSAACLPLSLALATR